MKALYWAIVFGLLAAAGWACGPFFAVTVFTYERHPDLPRTDYADGKLGVVLPSYARSYLVVAWRHVAGVGFDPREREQLLGYWTDRETGQWDKIDVDWQERWTTASAAVPGVPKSNARKITGGNQSFDRDTNSFVLNCAPDAFRTALHTLEARTSQFGASSRAVKAWTTAQVQVFDNCDDEKPAIPASASADLPELIRKDRAYQIAAAHFYAHQYEEAEQQFEAIAKDSNSPWRTLAPYLVARTIARTSGSGAETKARKILADPSLSSTHGMTYALLRRVLVAQKSEPYFHDLSLLLTSKGQGNGLREQMWEFNRLYDDFSAYDLWGSPDTTKKVNLEPIERDELPDWIATYQGLRPDAAKHGYERWKATQQATWLLAALARAEARSSNVPELIEAATRIPQDSPAYFTACFHRLRLMVDSGDAASARTALDTILKRGGMSKSSVNLFRGLRMRVAPDLAGFLRFAQRTPVLLTTIDDIAQVPSLSSDAKPQVLTPMLDTDATMVFNQRMPVAQWKQAAESQGVSPSLRGQISLAAFTRAALLGEYDVAAAVAPKSAASYYTNTGSAEEKKFAAAFAMLHLPGSAPYLRTGSGRGTWPAVIDDYRENWWCTIRPDVDLGLYHANTAPEKDHVDLAPSTTFLAPEAIAKAARERKALIAAGGGSKYLGRVALAFAKAHPDDPRVPEALHLAVRANRYACDAGDDWTTTRDCFRLLHSRYPKSEWTRKTPIWNR